MTQPPQQANQPSKIINRKILLVICGPTAIGKTALAIDVAKRLQTEIISADSRQFYREMSIGTAKPTAAELAEVPHHFINNLSIHDHYTAGKYEKEVLALLDQLFEKHHIVVMVGGSGLFIKAVCEGFDDFYDSGITDEVKERVRALTLEQMQAEVEKLDPAFYEVVDKHNPRRLQRALEVIYGTGQKYSEQRSGEKTQRPFAIVKVGLELDRPILNERINHRVDQMIIDGLWAEAEALYPFRYLQPLQTVGYQEIFDCMDGKVTRDEAISLIKQNTRQYAKRQMTWFKKDEEVQWFDAATDFSIAQLLERSFEKNPYGIYRLLPSALHGRPVPRIWADIADIYIGLLAQGWQRQAMLELVNHISCSPTVQEFIGYTSHDALAIQYVNSTDILWICIGDFGVADSNEDTCNFTFRSEAGELIMQYECPVREIIPTFDAFVSKVGW